MRVKVLDFPLKLSSNLFKPVLIKPSLFKLGLVKPSLNQVSAYHLKTSFSKTRFNLKPGLFLGDLLPCLCIRPSLFSMLQAYTNDFKYDLTCLRFSLIFL